MKILSRFALLAAGAISACSSSKPAAASSSADTVVTHVDEREVRAFESAIADDSLEGRATGSRGSAKAAAIIANAMRAAGLEPAGDSGFFQRVPVAVALGRNGDERLSPFSSFAALDTVPAARRRTAVNVLGILPGGDPKMREQVVLVDAHYDHLGIGRPVNGDAIYNGADDDASGTTGVVEIARALAKGPRPKRTIIFAATTGEEVGLLGTQWYIDHPARPLASMVANLEIEMIGRPDSLAGGAGKAWLTGFDRSTMGEKLAAAGIAIVADPRPDQQFFQRSDNIAFAMKGIPAHTLSTYNMHTDYHTPADDISRVDFPHMTAVINSALAAVRVLANDAAPTWKPNGRPGGKP
ncbi:MAG: M20/M25/M40 family metallo-hydrolase [Gemmatimonadota bacterium]|nr:M20/M25/M40 family metallo-hydrolase [Gemmatimonadota bacterium]